MGHWNQDVGRSDLGVLKPNTGFSQHYFHTNTSRHSSSKMIIKRLVNRSQFNSDEELLQDKIAFRKTVVHSVGWLGII